MSLGESWQSSRALPLKGLPAVRERKLPQVRSRNVRDHELSDQMSTSTHEAVDPLIKFLFVICLVPRLPAASRARGFCNYTGPFLQSDSCVEKAVGEMS